MIDATDVYLAPEQQAPSPSYEKPELRCLGDLREVTLGGSLGTGDSGNPGIQQF
ncbi:MAG: lasso RiPP family leader peptide-containing protein [Lysobacterales bacterium]